MPTFQIETPYGTLEIDHEGDPHEVLPAVKKYVGEKDKAYKEALSATQEASAATFGGGSILGSTITSANQLTKPHPAPEVFIPTDKQFAMPDVSQDEGSPYTARAASIAGGKAIGEKFQDSLLGPIPRHSVDDFGKALDHINSSGAGSVLFNAIPAIGGLLELRKVAPDAAAIAAKTMADSVSGLAEFAESGTGLATFGAATEFKAAQSLIEAGFAVHGAKDVGASLANIGMAKNKDELAQAITEGVSGLATVVLPGLHLLHELPSVPKEPTPIKEIPDTTKAERLSKLRQAVGPVLADFDGPTQEKIHAAIEKHANGEPLTRGEQQTLITVRERIAQHEAANAPIARQSPSPETASPEGRAAVPPSPSAETTRLASDAQAVGATETAKALKETSPAAETAERTGGLAKPQAAGGDRFILRDGVVFDNLYKTSITPPAMDSVHAAAIAKHLNASDFNGKYVSPVSIGFDPTTNETVLDSGGYEIGRVPKTPSEPKLKGITLYREDENGVRTPVISGPIGETHADLVKRLTPEDRDAHTLGQIKHGFETTSGDVLDRRQAADQALKEGRITKDEHAASMSSMDENFRPKRDEDIGLHSIQLKPEGVPSAKEPVTTPSPVSTEQGKPVDTQAKGASKEGDTRAQTPKIDKKAVTAYASKLPESTKQLILNVLNKGQSVEDAAADSGMSVTKAQGIIDKANQFLAKAKTIEPLAERSYADEPSKGRKDEIDAVKEKEDPRGDYAGGPGAMGPVEAEAMRQTQTRTSTKNAIVDEERQKRGQEPIMSQARQSIGETWDAAMREIDRNPNAGRDLVDELNKKSRAVTAKEEAVLLHHKVDVMNDLENATRQALDPEATPEEQAEAQARAVKLMDDLNDIDSATRASGAEWGRMGRFRQMLAAEDYSLSRMLQKKQMGLGRELTAEETDRISKLNSRIEELEKEVTEHQENTEKVRQQAKDEALSEAIKRMKESQSPAEKYSQSLLDRIQSGLKSEADKARQRIRERLGTTAAGVDPTVLYDAAVIGAEHLFKTGVDFAKWSAEMVKDIGEVIKPHLEAIFAQSQKINDAAVDKVAPASVRETIKNRPKTEEERRTRALENIKRNSDKPERIGSDIQKLAEGFVRSGITDRDELVAAVHNAVKDALPDATPRDIRDSISGYGDFKELNKDEVKTKLRDLKGQMQQVSKLEDMTQKGQLPAKTGIERRVPSAEERALIKEVNRVKKDLGLESTDPNQLKSALDAVKTRLRNRIEDLQRAIEKNEKITKPTKTVADDEEAADLRRQKDEVQKEYDAIFKEPKKTPDEIALAAYKTRVQNRIKELNDRVSRGDFSKAPKKTVNLDAEGMRLKAEAERAKLSFDREVAKDRLSKRSWWEKAIDFGPKFGRAALLSNPVTLGKLTAAAAWRMVVTPIEEGIASGLKRLPFVDQIAARAPREGGGFNVRAESKALTQGFVKGMKDAYDLLTKGETELDVTGGKRQVEPHSWVDVFGKIHGALKTVTKRNEFERSFQQRIEHAMNNGVDVTDPAVQARIAVESYKDANRSIFQQDNRVVSAYNMAIRRLEQVDKATGKVPIGSRLAAATMKTLFPIVKIPTNIVAEAFQYATGTITGSARLAKAFHDGVRTLKPEEADLIMRELKKGSLGAGLMMLGYLAPQVIGGYYQRGEKRKEGETKAGDIKLYGTEIPSYLLHNPAVEQLQIGATIRRVADANEKKGGKKGIPTGVAAAAFGLTEEVPFVRETTEIGKAMDPNQRGKFFGELARSRIEPQVIQWVAQQMDKKTPFSPSEEPVKRDPKTMVEFMESGIPGLRKNVPEKKKRR